MRGGTGCSRSSRGMYVNSQQLEPPVCNARRDGLSSGGSHWLHIAKQFALALEPSSVSALHQPACLACLQFLPVVSFIAMLRSTQAASLGIGEPHTLHVSLRCASAALPSMPSASHQPALFACLQSLLVYFSISSSSSPQSVGSGRWQVLHIFVQCARVSLPSMLSASHQPALFACLQFFVVKSSIKASSSTQY